VVTIKEAVTKRDVKKFMEYPNKLYKDNPYYVPDMLASQVADMDRKKNPAFEYCDAKCFLAYREGKIVGRIAAIYNTHANEKFGSNAMRFAHADYIDDDEVVDALFGAVEQWALSKGCASIHGPLGFNDMDREGLLVEGFDRLSLFFVYYNHPYYVKQMERMGFEKDVDWVEFRLTLSEYDKMERLDKLATLVQKRMKINVIDFEKKRDIYPYVPRVFQLYNEAYKKLYGTVALTDAQVDKYVGEFLPLLRTDTLCLIENAENELVAFGIAAPSLSLAQQKSKGRMFPFGWIHLLKALKGKNDTLDLFLIAVRPDLQGTGINAVIMNHLLKKALARGVRYAETGPELETNTDVQSQWRYFQVEQHKRRRCFIKHIGS